MSPKICRENREDMRSGIFRGWGRNKDFWPEYWPLIYWEMTKTTKPQSQERRIFPKYSNCYIIRLVIIKLTSEIFVKIRWPKLEVMWVHKTKIKYSVHLVHWHIPYLYLVCLKNHPSWIYCYHNSHWPILECSDQINYSKTQNVRMII